jgi:glycosyltransferase 2 family protein
MLTALRAIANFVGKRIGWHRIGIVLSITIIAIAATTLIRMLHNVTVGDIVKALRATPGENVVLAACFVAAGYFTLTFYDWFALRTIGRPDVPYRIAALASCCSYTIGHNVGAMVFTAAAVRYRIYSTRGLTVIDIAKVCFVTGLTFWLGNAFMLGLGIGYDPRAATAVDRLPPALNRLIAFALLAAIVGYLAWIWRKPRVIGRNNWQITLPSARLTLLQIGIGVLDLGFGALAMFVLMPVEPHIGLITLVIIYILSTLLGFASHAPGAIGVFDAAMLVALQQFDKGELIAGIILFRLLYYMLPLSLALTALGLRELWLVAPAAAMRGCKKSLEKGNCSGLMKKQWARPHLFPLCGERSTSRQSDEGG